MPFGGSEKGRNGTTAGVPVVFHWTAASFYDPCCDDDAAAGGGWLFSSCFGRGV